MNDNTLLKPGSSLQGGKYIVQQVLGQGGFGITYEAEQVSLGRRVAVKEFFMKDYCDREDGSSHVTLSTSSSSRELVEKFRQKFVREAKMIAGLDHDHIVKIHDVFEENGTAYYVMEYIGGGSLGEGVKAGKAMPEQEAISSIRQIASALEYLHKKGIIHFDVKPSNVLRTEDGKLKLIDFGISKHYDEAGVQTSSTPVGISKGYAPLEQYQQGSDIKSFTPATDIYSLGATLYALLTGSNPPEASVVNEDGIPAINGVSPIVMQAIEKAMQPRRKDRPQSVEEFLALLDGIAEDDEETFVAGAGAKTQKTKSDNEKKPATPEKQREQQKLKETKVAKKKTLPRWLYGLFAGVVVAVLAVALLSRPGKPDVPAATAQSSASSSASSTSGTHNGHEWVDLGLSVKWATMNVGASTASDYGSYFAWGETSPKSSYVWENLKYRTGGNNSTNIKLSKYNTHSFYGPVDNRAILELSDDAARANWGGSWRMPTKAEYIELINYCTWTRTTMNGKNGYRVKSKSNGNSIFLPAAGDMKGTNLDTFFDGDYWSSSLGSDYYDNSAYCLIFNSGKVDWSCHLRFIGKTVRPVYP